MKRPPRFSALKAFEAAVREGGVSAAARELNVTPGAISRQISALEEHLGVRLMRRSASGAEATEVGRKLYDRLVVAFQDIEDAVAEAAEQSGPQLLTLAVYPTFAIHWLLPRLARFHSQEPNIDLQIRTSANEARLDRDDVDLAQLIGDGQWPGLYARKLFSRRFAPVVSPKLLAELGPDPLKALRAARILYSDMHKRPWRLWFEKAQTPDLSIEGGVRFENSALAHQAAREGGGFALGQPSLLADDLRTGRLVAPFQTEVLGGRAYYIACRRADARRPAIEAFYRWLEGEIIRSEGFDA